MSIVLKSGFRLHLDVKKNGQLAELIDDVCICILISYYE